MKPARPYWRSGQAVLALLASGLGLFLFIFLGWIGLGLMGLTGLLIAQRLDLYGDSATAQFPAGVRYHAKWLDEQRRLPPERKQAERARQEARQRRLYIVNTICIALAALGFSMFVLHQL
ncbi:MAG: hypothetical protein MI920_28905 [Kiloniellales bacterium]|nr:hypothetical protein [Kiloniellales bacterium]